MKADNTVDNVVDNVLFETSARLAYSVGLEFERQFTGKAIEPLYFFHDEATSWKITGIKLGRMVSTGEWRKHEFFEKFDDEMKATVAVIEDNHKSLLNRSLWVASHYHLAVELINSQQVVNEKLGSSPLAHVLAMRQDVVRERVLAVNSNASSISLYNDNTIDCSEFSMASNEQQTELLSQYRIESDVATAKLLDDNSPEANATAEMLFNKLLKCYDIHYGVK